MVVIRELGTNKQAAEQVEQIISSVAPSTDIIIYEPLTDKRTVFYKTLKSKTQFEEILELDARQLPRWLVEEAKRLNASLNLIDASYMVERLGTNQAVLFNELKKLAIYDSVISKDTIDLNTEETPQSKIFDLLDEIFKGNKKKALRLYEDQRQQKIEPQAVLALISWQLNLIALAKAGRGKTAAQIAMDTGSSPYPIGKAQLLADRITDEKMRKIISEAVHMDHASKTYTTDMDEALKAFIISL